MASHNYKHHHEIEGAMPAPIVAPDAEIILDIDKEKGSSDFVEDVKETTFEDVNSPEAILYRYPLLRNKSQKELDLLNHKVKRIIDIRMLPMITLCLIINYLDRSNVTNARVAGMQADMHMTDVQWSAGISLFYAGYMLTQASLRSLLPHTAPFRSVPGSLLLSKYKPRIMIPAMMLGWSIPTIMFPLVKSPVGFMMARFAVGLAEGPFLPAVALMTSSWYVREELPFRMALWHGAQCISNVFGGPLAAGILETMEGVAGLRAWQWFMLIEGAMSITIAIAAAFTLPNWANNTPWMDAEMTEMAQYRLVLSAGGHDEADSSLSMWAGFKMAMRDPFSHLFMGLHFALLSAQSFKDFLPSILRTMSSSKLMTYLLQSPAYLLGYLAILGFGYSSGRFRDSVWHVIGPILLSAVGTVMLITTMNVGVRYTGVCFLIMGVFSGLNIQVSWETQLVPSPRHKKAALIAYANTLGTASHWFTPYFFLTNQAPLYRFGGALILVSIAITIILVFITRWYIIRLNKRKDAEEAAENETRVQNGLEPKPKGWRFPL